jgi:hypothetical protein
MISFMVYLNGCNNVNDNSPVKDANDNITPIEDVVVNPFPPEVLNSTPVFYVDNNNPSVSDSNPGTESAPWSTIAHAVNTADSSSKIIVKAGDYNERVTIKTGGNQNHFFVVEAEGVVNMHGFIINAEYVAVKGFTITDTTPPISLWKGSGFWINANNVYILNNSILNFLTSAGISPSWANDDGWNNIQIENNYIYGCNQGLGTSGTNWLVINNEIERLIRGTDGFDADYMRIFGDTIVIKNNYFHGTRQEEIGASHTDVFQTYWKNGNFAHNVLIEENIATDFFHQGIMAEASGHSHYNIIVRKNIFADGLSWGICNMGIINCFVENNIFYNIKTHGVGFRRSKSGVPQTVYSSGRVKNNIFMNAGSNYWKEEGCSYDNGYNLLYPAQAGGIRDITGVDPLFVDPSNIIGPDGLPFTDDDGLRLQPGSPAIGNGEDGVNIGAY